MAQERLIWDRPTQTIRRGADEEPVRLTAAEALLMDVLTARSGVTGHDELRRGLGKSYPNLNKRISMIRQKVRDQFGPDVLSIETVIGRGKEWRGVVRQAVDFVAGSLSPTTSRADLEAEAERRGLRPIKRGLSKLQRVPVEVVIWAGENGAWAVTGFTLDGARSVAIVSGNDLRDAG